MSAPHYGYGPISETASEIITSLFPPASPIPVSSESSPSGSWNEDTEKNPCLVEFIAYALYRTRLPDEIVYAALLLLSRLREYYPGAKGTPTSPHRLFISALMLSSKMSMDDTYSNKSWVIVAQDRFDLKELNQMERELFSFLKCNCCITGQELEDWRQEWCPAPPSPPKPQHHHSHQHHQTDCDETGSQQLEESTGSGSSSSTSFDADDGHSPDSSTHPLRDSSSPDSSFGIVTPSSPSPITHSQWMSKQDESIQHHHHTPHGHTRSVVI